MERQYEEWIDAYVTRHKNFVRGKCTEAATEMVAAFPELKRVCGFVLAPWGEDQHWWCVSPTGEVVDPTVAQFPATFGYEEVDPANPHRPIPTGKCMDCGDRTYNGDTFCNEACEQATREYMGL